MVFVVSRSVKKIEIAWKEWSFCQFRGLLVTFEDTKNKKHDHLKLDPCFDFLIAFSKISFVETCSNLESTRPLADYRIYVFLNYIIKKHLKKHCNLDSRVQPAYLKHQCAAKRREVESAGVALAYSFLAFLPELN